MARLRAQLGFRLATGEPSSRADPIVEKKSHGRRVDRRGEGCQPQAGATAGPRGARQRWRECSRIVKDVFRNKKPGSSDESMEASCGLHNLRVKHRNRCSKDG